MPKGVYLSDSVKNGIKNDYYERKMTVDEIAAKYSVGRRTIYSHIKADRYNSYSATGGRKMTYLSRDDVELILLMIQECDHIFKGNNKSHSKVLEERMLTMADNMTIFQ